MRRIKITFVAVMGLLLVLPGLEMIYPFVDIPPLEENRRLMPFPSTAQVFARPHQQRAWVINTWFNDHMGFRSLLTRISNQIDYTLFDYSRLVLIGRDGWLFEKFWISQQTKQELLGAALQQKLRDKILEVSRYLAERKVKLVIVPIPVSATVYPEFLPANSRKPSRPTQLEQLGAFLKTRPDVIYVDAIAALDPGNAPRLFQKTDHHLNAIGDIRVARALVRAIAAAEKRPDDPWKGGVRILTQRNARGALARFLAVFDPPAETLEYFDLASMAGGPALMPGPPPFESTYRNETATRGVFPPIVMFGNSFADGLALANVYELFGAVYRFRSHGQELDVALHNTPPDARYFVLQFIEPYMDFLADAKLPDSER